MPSLRPLVVRWSHGVYRYFWLRFPASATGAKIVWVVYAAFGTALILWDASARGEHIASTLLVSAYAFPSSLLSGLLAFTFTTGDPSRTLTWFLMVSLNGWLVFRIFCRFKKRDAEA
jgi:hypothetical protein